MVSVYILVLAYTCACKYLCLHVLVLESRCTCACMCLCLCLHVLVPACTCTWIKMYLCLHVHVPACTCACMYLWLCLHVLVPACTCACRYMCIYLWLLTVFQRLWHHVSTNEACIVTVFFATIVLCPLWLWPSSWGWFPSFSHTHLTIAGMVLCVYMHIHMYILKCKYVVFVCTHAWVNVFSCVVEKPICTIWASS